MASTVAKRPSESTTLTIDSLLYVDMTTLTQSELHALSVCSSSAFDLHRTDDLVIPSIDRSTFNESAGSRRQVFSRTLPSSPTHYHHHHRHHRVAGGVIPSLKNPPVNEDPDRRENHSIISFLKQSLRVLPEFHDIDFDYVPPYSEFQDTMSHEAAVNSENFGVGGDRKRKRGGNLKEKDALEEKEKGLEIVNKNGVAVDLVKLADLEDPYGEELRRRTEGMGSEEELLGFLRDLDGSWCSRRRKRRIVDASILGDALPLGWKLLLGLRRKVGRAWIYCRRYISPGGRHLVTCKEVCTYLQSCFEQDAHGTIDQTYNNVLQEESAASESKHTGVNYDKDAPRHSNDQSKDVTLLSTANLAEVQVCNLFECRKCSLKFDEKDTYLQHLLSVHQKSTRKYRLGSSVGDGVIVKDGKFECQFCHKTFRERRRYNGHVGIHVRNYVRCVDEPPGHSSLEKGSVSPIKDELPTRISKMDALIEIAQNSILENSVASSEPTDESTQDEKVATYNQELPSSIPHVELNSTSPLSESEIKGNPTDDMLELNLSLENNRHITYEEKMETINDTSAVDLEMDSCLETSITLSIDNRSGINPETFCGEAGMLLATDETKNPGNEEEKDSEHCLLPLLSTKGVSDPGNTVLSVSASTLEALETAELSNNDNFEFGNYDGQSNEIVGNNEEYALCNVPESICMLQPSHDMQTFDISHKGDDGLCIIDHLDLTDIPLDMEHTEAMDQMFDSSVQIGSEEVLLQMAGSSQLTTFCVWCGIEFSHGGIDSVQSDSVGYMCPTCKLKISGQLSALGGGSP